MSLNVYVIRLLLLVIIFPSSLEESVSSHPIIGLIQDGSYTSIHGAYHESVVATQLALRDLYLRYSWITPTSTWTTEDLIKHQWAGSVIVAKCTATRKILRTLVNRFHFRPENFFAIKLESCKGLNISSVPLQQIQHGCLSCLHEKILEWAAKLILPLYFSKYYSGQRSESISTAKFSIDELSTLMEPMKARRHYLRNRRMLIGADQFTPLTTCFRDPSGKVDCEGLFKELLVEFAEHLGFEFDLVQNVGFKYANNTKVGGLFGMLIRKEIDMGLYPFPATSEIFRAIGMSTMTFPFRYSILIPVPREQANFGAIFQPFDTTVWIALAVSTLVVTSFLALLTKRTTYFQAWQTQFFYTFYLLFGQAGENDVKSLPARIIKTVWCLLAFLVLYSYTSNLISYLMVPRAKRIIASIEDLAYKKPLKVLTTIDGWLDLFPPECEGALKIIREDFLSFPERLVQTYQDGYDKVTSGDYAFIASEALQTHLIDGNYKRVKKCETTIAKHTLGLAFSSWGTEKNSILTELISLKTLHSIGHGIGNRMGITYKLAGQPRCTTPAEYLNTNTVIAFSNIIGSIYMYLGALLMLSVFAFVAEILYFLAFDKKPKKLPRSYN